MGHGLAGAVLAHTLVQKKEQVIVLDAGMPNSASAVSAGLINPFIGPKLNTPEDYSECMQSNQLFFERIYNATRIPFLEAIELIRVFQNSEQKKRWSALPEEYKLGVLSKSECLNHKIHADEGAGITAAWILHSAEFLKYSRNHFQKIGCFLNEFYEEEKWKGYRVVFCDGFRATENPWFKDLPFAPAQGEVITLESSLMLNVSNGTWHLADKEAHAVKIGSTWKHDLIECGPTDLAKNEIFKKMNFLPDINQSKLLAHKSGVRSGTRDRNPIIGVHPDNENLHIFNGFGSRGCTTIVQAAKELAGFMIGEIELPKRKDLKRFLS